MGVQDEEESGSESEGGDAGDGARQEESDDGGMFEKE